jgi:hypothetical protein
VIADNAQGHLFDQADVHAAVQCEADQCGHFVVVAMLEDHAVELDALETGLQGSIDACECLGELAVAGDGPEALGSGAIQADVDACDAGRRQCACVARELRPVRGEREVADAGHGPELLEQPDHAAPDQRLAAGDAELGHPELAEAAPQSGRFLEGLQLLARQELQILGHAIDAA